MAFHNDTDSGAPQSESTQRLGTQYCMVATPHASIVTATLFSTLMGRLVYGLPQSQYAYDAIRAEHPVSCTGKCSLPDLQLKTSSYQSL